MLPLHLASARSLTVLGAALLILGVGVSSFITLRKFLTCQLLLVSTFFFLCFS